MARIASTALVVALLAATATAFALTEGLKLEPSPILGTQVDETFSPTCGCDRVRARISFRLRRTDRIDVALLDDADEVVATPVQGRRFPRGRVVVEWNGLNAAGEPLPEGAYRPRVHLRGERRTIVLPNPIELDTTPPEIASATVTPHVFSPDGDRRADRLSVDYRLTEPGKALLYVNGVKRVETRFPRERDTLSWYGLVDRRAVPAGRYALVLRAKDPAGNLSDATHLRVVVVRFVALGRRRVVALAGARFAIRVSSDARNVHWRLGRRSGTAGPGTLHLRAPSQPGRFTLTVSANGHEARAAVFVRKPAR